MKKLFFSAVAVMVMVSVSNTFASKSAMNMAAPEDTTVSAPADTTVSAPVSAPAEEPAAEQPSVNEEPAADAPSTAEPEDTSAQQSDDTAYMMFSDSVTTDSSSLAML